MDDAFTGTRAPSQSMDAEALAAWLAREIDGFAGPLTIEQFKGGQSNPTYAGRDLRDARQAGAGGQAAAVRARDRT